MLIRELLDRTEAIDLSKRPPKLKPVEKGDEVLGVLPPDLQKLMAVMDDMIDELTAECGKVHKLFEGQLLGAMRADSLEQLIKQIESLRQQGNGETGFYPELEKHLAAHKRLEDCKSVFWAEVEQKFPKAILAKRPLGICENNQVVLKKPPKRSPIIVGPFSSDELPEELSRMVAEILDRE